MMPSSSSALDLRQTCFCWVFFTPHVCLRPHIDNLDNEDEEAAFTFFSPGITWTQHLVTVSLPAYRCFYPLWTLFLVRSPSIEFVKFPSPI